MQRHYQIANGKLTEIEDANALLTAYVNPTPAEKDQLIQDLKIDEHTLQSALDPDELARLEFEPEHAALIFKRPKHYSGEDDFLFKVASTGAFIFRDRLIIVVAEDVPLFDNVKLLLPDSPCAIVLKLLNRAIFHFREHLRVISMISDDLQNKINLAMENRNLINLFTLQKSLVYYLDSINSNGVLIERLRHNGKKMGFTTEEIETLDDIGVENGQCYKQAEIYSNILVSLMDARASIVSNNLNVLMKRLNIITIGIMVPTFVVSAFSMNLTVLPLVTHPMAFYYIMALAGMSVLAFLMFWRLYK